MALSDTVKGWADDLERQLRDYKSISPASAPKRKIAKKMVSMPKKEFVGEHKRLLKVLKTGKGIKGEYKKQKTEITKRNYPKNWDA